MSFNNKFHLWKSFILPIKKYFSVRNWQTCLSFVVMTKNNPQGIQVNIKIKIKQHLRMYFLRELLSYQWYIRRDANSSLKKCTSVLNTVIRFVWLLAGWGSSAKNIITKYRVQMTIYELIILWRNKSRKWETSAVFANIALLSILHQATCDN